MLIERANLKTRVKHANPKEVRWLSQYLSFPDRRFGARKTKNARIAVFNELQSTFPSGYCELVIKAAQNDGIALTMIDRRKRPCTVDLGADLEWLQHHPATDEEITHQIDAVHAIHKHERGILWIPTGGGKTEVAIGLAKSLPCPWLFLVGSKDLLHQTIARYQKRVRKRAGIVGEGRWEPANRFTVATFQTLYAALKKDDPRAWQILRHARGLVVDESHTLPADSFLRVAMAARNAYYRVGMSGTPLDRGDRRSILSIGALGPVVLRVRAQELVEKGVTANANVTMVQLFQMTTKKTWAGAYRELVVRSKQRNRIVVKMATKCSKPALLFVNHIDHGKSLLVDLRRAGLQAEFVWGKHGTKARKSALDELEMGDLDVVICSTVFQQGVDIVELRAVVNGSAGASVIAALQRLGRGGRATRDKSTFEVWDVDDEGNEWLRRHARKRKRSYKSEGYKIAELTSL